MNVNSFAVSALAVLLCSAPYSTAEPIYRGVDAAGRTIYSSSKPAKNSVVAALPTIGKWQPRQVTISDATCEKHGGVSCEAGADADGSVVCLDGYRDALSTFKELCQLAKLSVLAAPQRPADSVLSLTVTVKNESAAPANQVLVSFIINKFDPPLLFSGPDKIEPYSVADYVVKTTLDEVPLYRKLSVSDVSVECGNCK